MEQTLWLNVTSEDGELLTRESFTFDTAESLPAAPYELVAAVQDAINITKARMAA